MTPEKKRSFISLLIVTTLDNFGMGIVMVMFAPLILSGKYGFLPADTSVAIRNIYLGILFAAFSVTQFFGAPILGDIADRTGRKKALLITILGVFFGFLLSGAACIFTNIYFLIISRLITGFFAGNMSICFAGIADLSPNEKVRSRNFGIVTVVWGISWNIAMLVGGYLSDPTKSKYFSPALPFWITAFVTFLSLFVVWKLYHETHPVHAKHPFNIIKGLHNVVLSLKIKEIRPFFLVVLFWGLGWGLSVQWYGTYSILEFGASQEAISWGLLIQGCFWMLGGSIINPLLIKKYRALTVGALGYFVVIIFLVLSALPSELYLFNIFFWIAAVFSSFAFSNSMSLTSIHAPEKIQGKVMGLTQSMLSLAFIFVPMMGGVVGGANAALFYPLSAGLCAICLIILISQRKK